MPIPALMNYSPTACLTNITCLGVSLAFNPIKLILLIVWVYLCLYFVQRVEFSTLVPKNRKSIANIFTLFAGPIPLLVLLIIDAAKKSSQSGDSVLAIIAEHIQNAIANIKASGFGRPKDDAKIKLFDTAGRGLNEIYGHGKTSRGDRHVLELTEQIILDALEEEASDILIDPKDESTYTVRFRVDGVLRTVNQIEVESGLAVINSIKAVSSMDISEKRRPQDGAFTARTGDSAASFRVASAGVLHGEKLSVRVLNQSAGTYTLQNVGLMKKQRAIIKDAISKPSGMILMCGPTGSGKTTTLYAMLNELDFFTRNVITVEDPIECMLPNVSQIEVNPRADITFAKSLRSILRQDPDVISVGEIRDEETAAIALRASQTGHLVLATVHSDTNASALIRLLDLGVTPVLMSSGLSVLVCQRLLRRLCTKCRKPADLSKSQIDYLHGHGMRHDNVFQAEGCKHCHETGYRRRLGVFDILVLDDRLRARIANSELSMAALRTDGNKKGISNLKKEGLRLVESGLTSLEELKRVVG